TRLAVPVDARCALEGCVKHALLQPIGRYARLASPRILVSALGCADTGEMFRGSEEADRRASGPTGDEIGADLEARRVSAEHWVRQAHAATSSAQQIRDDLGRRRALAERRRAELLTANLEHSIDGRRTRRLAFFDADFCLSSDRTEMLTAM